MMNINDESVLISVQIQKEVEEILQTCSKCLYNLKLLQT